MLVFAIGWTDLRDEVATIARRGDVPAGAIVIVDDGEIVLSEGFGAADETTPFRIGSITKTVMALAALETGIDIEQPVALPNVETPFAEPVTLLHLLEHSAGLGELSRAEFAATEPVALSEVIARPRRSLSPPGFVRSYSNVNPGFTAHLLEAVTGRPYVDVVAERVFEPLRIEPSFEPLAHLPGGFRADGETPIPYWHMTTRAMGALNISALDFAQLLRVLSNASRAGSRQVFQPTTVHTLLTRRSIPIDTGYAAGTRAWTREGHLLHGHGGDADGYRAHFGVIPAARRGYFVVINTDNPRLLRRMRTHIETALVADLTINPAPPRRADDLPAYAGRYYPARVRFRSSAWQRGELPWFDVFERDGELIVRGPRTTRLVPLGGGRFRAPDERVVTAVARTRGGVTFLTGSFGDIARLGSECQREPPWPDGFLPRCLWR